MLALDAAFCNWLRDLESCEIMIPRSLSTVVSSSNSRGPCSCVNDGVLFRIFWPKTVSNLELHAKSNSKPIRTTIKRRCLRRLGHVLKMSHNRFQRVALRWTPQGKKKQSRP